MSETTRLNEVLKASTEVTSLDSTDRVLAFDANGNPKKINQTALTQRRLGSVSFNSPQWIRIGYCSGMGSALISLTTVYSSLPGVHLLIDMILHPNGPQYNQVAVLSRLVNGKNTAIDKIRVLCRQSYPVYVDIHYNASVAHSFFVELLAGRTFSLLGEFGGDAQIPDGYSVREFSLATVSDSAEIVGGGVSHYSTISYELSSQAGRKGGRHERYDSRHQCNPIDEVCGQSPVPRTIIGRGYTPSGERFGSRVDGVRDRCERMHIVGHLGAYVICGQHSFRNVPEHTRMSSVQLESDPYPGYVHAQRIRRKGSAEIYGQWCLERLEGVLSGIVRKEVAA